MKTKSLLAKKEYKGRFSIERDQEVINDGGFFCHACISGQPEKERSENLEYCKECYEVIQKEAQIAQVKKERMEEIVKRAEAVELKEKLGDGYQLDNRDGHFNVVQVATGKKVNGTPLKLITTTDQEVTEQKTDTKPNPSGKITIEEMVLKTGIKWSKIYGYVRENGFEKELNGKGKPRFMLTPDQVAKITEALKK